MSRKSLKVRIMEWFTKAGGRAVDKSELARSLKVPTEERAEFKKVLRELLAEGRLEEGRGGRFRVPAARPAADSRGKPADTMLAGRLMARADGLFFIPDPANPANAPVCEALEITPETRLPVDPAKAATGLHGDRVTVKIAVRLAASARAGKPQRGARGGKAYHVSVVEVTERRNTTLPGALHIRGQHAWVEPDDVFLPAVEVKTEGHIHAKHGDKVVVHVDDWTPRGKRLRGHIVKRLGVAGEPGVDVLGIIAKHHLPLEFPREVLRDAEAWSDQIPPAEIARREDWRGHHVITIDPFDAKDFDDAICVSEKPGGGWELAVHIADVSHYVVPGTALDREALRRGNSTYLVDRVLPMLPERLSNGLCSLRPGEDKLTRAAVMTFNARGQRTGQRFVSAVIHSKRRYTYEEAMAALKEPPRCDPDAELLHRAWKLASMLRRRRFANGSLDMQFTEVKVILDAQGHPVRFARITYDESHQLIEEFMLAANEAVAETILRSGRPGIYRVHEDPDPAKLDELREIYIACGIPCGDFKVKGEIQKALKLIEGRPEEHVLKVSLLKSLKRAAYSADSLGHFGLSLQHYTHFTSPIRRYADLVVHRVLGNLVHAAGSRGATRTPDYAAMQEIGRHLSETERTSADAEMDSRRMKELEYFERIAASPKPQVFQAVVTRVLPIGLFVEVVEIQTRGIVRAGDPAYRDYRYDFAQQRLVSRTSSRKTVRTSDIINVIPVGIERERGTVVFRAVEKLPGVKAPAAKRKKDA